MALKKLVWIGSSKKDLKEFPDEIQRSMGHALHAAQHGKNEEQHKGA